VRALWQDDCPSFPKLHRSARREIALANDLRRGAESCLAKGDASAERIITAIRDAIERDQAPNSVG